MEKQELYAFMVNQIETLQKSVGIMSRYEVTTYFIGYFKVIDEEKFDLINKLYQDGIIKA